MDLPPFDKADFKRAFVQYFPGEVRPHAVIALHELVAGEVMQGSYSVSKYAERFYQRSRRLSDESQATLCLYFLNETQNHVSSYLETSHPPKLLSFHCPLSWR